MAEAKIVSGTVYDDPYKANVCWCGIVPKQLQFGKPIICGKPTSTIYKVTKPNGLGEVFMFLCDSHAGNIAKSGYQVTKVVAPK